MANNIQIPVIGPTKSNTTKADALDAAISNPNFVCATNRTEFFLTSTPYPLYAFDSLDEAMSVQYASVFGWEPLDLDDVMTLQYVDLIHVISYVFHTQPPLDFLDEDMSLLFGNLIQTIDYVQYAHPADDFLDEDMALLYGTLVEVIQYIDYEHLGDSDLDEDMTLLYGTLTDI